MFLNKENEIPLVNLDLFKQTIIQVKTIGNLF